MQFHVSMLQFKKNVAVGIGKKLLLTKCVILTGPGSVWFGLVRNCSDFDSSGSVSRKRVYGSVCDQSEPSS